MFIKWRIKRLEKKLAKLKQQNRKNDEIIKFLGVELFKVCDETYNLNGTTGLKSIDINNYTHIPNKLYIQNSLTKMEVTTFIKGE